MSLRELWAKLRDWRRRDELDAELLEELRFHQQQLARDGGHGAFRQLGNLTRIKEETRDMWSTAGLVQPLLFRQPARDPLIYAAVALLLLTVAGVASAMPALRATRADPNAALRSE